MNVDQSKIVGLLDGVVGFLRGVLPSETRAKIYRIAKIVLGPIAVLAGIAATIAPMFPEYSGQVVAISGAVGIGSGLLLSALANLAGENITPEYPESDG